LVKGYFGKENVHYLKFDALELDIKLARQKNKNLANKAQSILNKTGTLPSDHPFRIQLCNFIYEALIDKNDIAPSTYYLDQIVKIKEEIYGEDSPEYAKAQIDLARHNMLYLDNLKEAERLYDEYFYKNLRDEISTGYVKYLSITNDVAELFAILDRYDEASELLDKSLLAARKKYDNTDLKYGDALNKIARLQIDIGEYEKAEKNVGEAIKIYDEWKGDASRFFSSQAMETKARLLAIKGLYDEAESALQESSKLADKAEVSFETSQSSTSAEALASLYIDIGNYSDTEELLQQTITDYESKYGKVSRKLIGPLIEKSRLLLITGEYTESEKVGRRAAQLAETIYGKKSTKTARAYNQLASVYTAIGDYEKAMDNTILAIEILENQFGKEHIDVAKSISQLAVIKYYRFDNPEEIEDLYEESREIITKKLGFQSPLLAEVLKNMAALYIREGRTDDAFNLLDQSQRIWEGRLGRRNNVNLAGIFTLKGDIYYFQRQYETANDFYDDARKVYKKVFNESHPDYVKVTSKMGKVAYMQGDSKKSKKYIEESLFNYNNFIKDYFPALSEREKAKFWNKIKGDFEFYNTLAIKTIDDDKDVLEKMYNNAITTKALLLNSSRKIRQRIVNSNDEELKSKFTEWLKRKEQLTNIISHVI
jgi:ATP/maltotriose-dependent transcriptional regulator MalT